MVRPDRRSRPASEMTSFRFRMGAATNLRGGLARLIHASGRRPSPARDIQIEDLHIDRLNRNFD